jgi:hypothetical protein
MNTTDYFMDIDMLMLHFAFEVCKKMFYKRFFHLLWFFPNTIVR